MIMNTNNTRRQRGAVLLTGLLFLLVLSIVAAVTMQGTTLEVRMATNNAVHIQAFEASEGLRVTSGMLLDEHAFHRGWPTTVPGGAIDTGKFTVNMPTDLNIKDKDADTDADFLYLLNTEPADPTWVDLQSAGLFDLASDMDWCVSNPDSGDCAGKSDISATSAIYRTQSALTEGTGAAMIAGYEGLGVGTAGAGGSLFFEIRSTGNAPVNARVITASEYRHIVRN